VPWYSNDDLTGSFFVVSLSLIVSPSPA